MDNGGKNSILVIDGEKTDLETLYSALSAVYTVYKTESGSSGIEMAHNCMPDVILLDIIMPDMSGYDVLETLKKSEKTRHIPVILISGSDAEDEEKGFDLEAADFIYKPFSAKTVKARVRNQIRIINQIRIREKSKFFAKISHEMRTPLNAVIGMAEMTLEAGGLSEEARENIEKISNAGMSLLGLVNDVLDISKIEAGKFEFVPVEYDTAAVINDAAVQSITRKGEKPVEFLLNMDENIPKRLYGDDLRIKQVLNNLLSNAFKYTREGTVELTMKTVPEGEAVRLIASVRDTGIGIKKENLDILFGEYAQMDLSANRKIEGTGLGLSITKMIVNLMGGRISVESEYGKGSVFTVEIPQKIATNEALGKETAEQLKKFNYSSKRKKRLTRISLPYARVLVVDDAATNLDVARGMMKPYRMEIDCVSGGQQAIDKIREGEVKYSAIFMDHMMPVMDGMEAVRIIREEIGTDYAKTVPIIAFTANALAGNEEMFLSRGFNAFISKPVNVDKLDEVIRKWVRDEAMENRQTVQDGVYNSRTGHDRRTGKDDRRGGYDRRLFNSYIQGLDLNRGLERFCGDWENFLEILKSFAHNTRLLLDVIKDAQSPDYTITIHAIKGSCRGICADELGNQAEALENAARTGNMDFISKNNQLFIEAVLKLIIEIEITFCPGTSVKKKIKKDKPDMDILRKLSDACKSLKIADIEELFRKMDLFEYKADDGLAEWLRENICQMNYAQIAARLSSSLNDDHENEET